MTRTAYVRHLEHDLEASRKVINDLTQENHHLREILKAITENHSNETSKHQRQ